MCDQTSEAPTLGFYEKQAKEQSWLKNQQAAMAGMLAGPPPTLLYQLRNERAKLSQELSNTERLIKWLEMNPDAPLMIDLLRDRAKGV